MINSKTQVNKCEPRFRKFEARKNSETHLKIRDSTIILAPETVGKTFLSKPGESMGKISNRNWRCLKKKLGAHHWKFGNFVSEDKRFWAIIEGKICNIWDYPESKPLYGWECEMLSKLCNLRFSKKLQLGVSRCDKFLKSTLLEIYERIIKISYRKNYLLSHILRTP